MPKVLYGAKWLENMVQSLAFVFIMDVALQVKDLTGLKPAHQVHDELIYVVPEQAAEILKEIVLRIMSTPPEWMPTLPVAAEGGVGTSYGNAKD
jgi:DNA polymerase I-like protein with 3'-5' exonuclease and polymerase domains